MSDDARRIEPGPLSALLGFRLVRVDEHEALVEADPAPEHLNGGGIVHGGYLSALLDTTTGWAVHAQVPPGVAAPHVQIAVQFVRAALPGTTRAASRPAGGSPQPRPRSPRTAA
jgi:acyl-CoA thioesterase